MNKTISDNLGKQFLEEPYGGEVKQDHDDVMKYFST